MADTNKINQIKLPNGQQYEIDAKYWGGYETSDVKTINGESIFGEGNIEITLPSSLKYCGVTTTKIEDGSKVNPVKIGEKEHIATTGCVVFYEDKEFVFNANSEWELFGAEATYKVVQDPIFTPDVSGDSTAFIDTISQDANGVITVTKKNVDMPIVKGDAENSGVLKGEYQSYSNKAISQTSMAVGAATTAGLKGWYYSKIEFGSTPIITLSDKQPSVILGYLSEGSWTSGTPNIKVGDKISIVNNAKYDYCGEVKSISNNKVTLKSALPFDKLDTGLISLNNPDDWSIYLPDNESAGIIDFGGGALAEGVNTKSTNIGSHAEGIQTHAYGQYAHTEGRETKAGYAAHAEGRETTATGEQSHTEGRQTIAYGNCSHAEGRYTVSSGVNSHAEGEGKTEGGTVSLRVGAHGRSSHVEGMATTTGEYNEQTGIWSKGDAAHAEGNSTIASGNHAHAEGSGTEAIGWQSHAEGHSSIASGNRSHAEGSGTQASGQASHAEGEYTTANGNYSHAEGRLTITEGDCSHAEGSFTYANGEDSHAEGYQTEAKGPASHAEGWYTIANNTAEHASGKFNQSTKSPDTSQATHFSIGIGTSDTDRKNAFEVKQNGDIYIEGVEGRIQDKLNTSTSVTPDWNARGGEDGYIKNRTHRIYTYGVADPEYHDDGHCVVTTSYLSKHTKEAPKFALYFRDNKWYNNAESVDSYGCKDESNILELKVGNSIIKRFNNTDNGDHDPYFLQISVEDVYVDVYDQDSDDENTVYRYTLFVENAGGYGINVNEVIPFIEYGNVVTLNDIYIPNTIARKSDIATPDWNAQEGEAGYIENKPFEYGYSYKEDINTEFAATDYTQSFFIFSEEDVYKNFTLRYNGELYYDDEGTGDTYKIRDISGSILVNKFYETISDSNFSVACYYDDSELGYFIAVTSLDGIDWRYEVRNANIEIIFDEKIVKIDDKYLSDTVIKTIPQTLSDTDKNQALANLGLTDIVHNSQLTEEVSNINKTIEDNEKVVAAALNELNDELKNISVNTSQLLVNITYSELVNLRDNGELIPGQQYRITDYTTTTVQENTQSAGHQFDIIVTADDVNVLNENVRAIQHTYSDTDYFANSNLNAWKIWYSLDNDTSRFVWADTENGKGVIYRMIDEFSNDCPYDFKNIMFKRWKLNAPELKGSYDEIHIKMLNNIIIAFNNDVLSYTYGCFENPDNGRSWDSNGNIVSSCCGSNIFEYFYTFSNVISGDISDKSLNINGEMSLCSENIIKKYTNGLNNIIFFNSSFDIPCCNNTFDVDCYFNNFGDIAFGNTFGIGCSNNTFGLYCAFNIFGAGCCYNSLLHTVMYNTFGNDCIGNSSAITFIGNTFGNSCVYNIFADSCDYNSFGYDCNYNSFGNECDYNSFGGNCSYNSFGEYCDYNSFGYDCNYNSFGNSCSSNSFGSSCHSNSFGNNCDSNSFGNDCNYNSFGNNCSSSSFGNDCEYNSFRLSQDLTGYKASGDKMDCVRNVHYGDGCNNIVLYANPDNVGTINGSNSIRNINVAQGLVSKINGGYPTFVELTTTGQDYEIKVARNSAGDIKVFCLADLIA